MSRRKVCAGCLALFLQEQCGGWWREIFLQNLITVDRVVAAFVLASGMQVVFRVMKRLEYFGRVVA
jgi:hypothetical protein